MKKLILLMIFGVLLVSSIGFVIAANENNNSNANLNANNDSNEIECEDLTKEECEVNSQCSYYSKDDYPDKEDNETEDDVEGWCKNINAGFKGDNDNEPKGYAFGYRFKLEDSNMTKEEFKARIREKYGNKSEEGEDGELKVQLSNGRKANIKIMPNTASETALNRLRLNVCSEENNCSIELKEVGKGEGNKTRAVYEMQIQRHHKLLGMFRIKAQNRVQVDAETGEIIKVKKPWWAFLASDVEEVE